MAALKCDICGGKIIMQPGGEYGICESCEVNYTIDRMREIASGIKVSVTGTSEDVEQWKALVNTYLQAFDYGEAEKIVKKILEASPGDEFANEVYSQIRDWACMQIEGGVLKKYTGAGTDIVIPKGVKIIAREAFDGNVSIRSIKIPEGITGIGASAFKGCTSLTSINIPEGVRKIGDNAFEGCTSLTSINIPKSVTEIAWFAFENCTSLTSINIPKSVTKIVVGAFENCTSLTSINIPESVRKIEENAFKGCTSLTSINIPESVTDIEYGAFRGTPYEARREREEQAREEQARRWKAAGLCTYCGGKKKFLSHICSKCGRLNL